MAIEIARSANTPITTPDTTLIVLSQVGVMRDRKAPIAVVSTTHHAPDPAKTPSVIRADSPLFAP
jgi:hypothetical protein